MNRASILLVLLPLAALAACGDSGEGGSNVALRDMEVIDGTANDSMVDLDNVQSDIPPVANAAAPAGADRGSPPATPANESAPDAEAEAPDAE